MHIGWTFAPLLKSKHSKRRRAKKQINNACVVMFFIFYISQPKYPLFWYSHAFHKVHWTNKIHLQPILPPKIFPQTKNLRLSLGTITTIFVRAPNECIGELFIFASDEALMCQDNFRGRSRYYYRNGESFDGISIVPEHQEKFEMNDT